MQAHDDTTRRTAPSLGPQALAGLKVIELGQLIAGPFAGKTLADFGAEVIKIEPRPRTPQQEETRCASGACCTTA